MELRRLNHIQSKLKLGSVIWKSENLSFLLVFHCAINNNIIQDSRLDTGKSLVPIV